MNSPSSNITGICGLIIKKINGSGPCLRERGHAGGHNPFSATAPVSSAIKRKPVDPHQNELWGEDGIKNEPVS